MNKSVYGNMIAVNVATPGALKDLTDVTITSPSPNQVLSYNGAKWVNSSSASPIQSVFARTGNVTAVSGDYNISQITNASTLATTADVNIVSPTNNQIVKYNSSTSKWENSSIPTDNTYYTQYNTYSTDPVTATKNTHYILNFGGTITIPPLAVGEHIMVTGTLNNTTVTFSGTSFIQNWSGSSVNPTIILRLCTIELMCVFNDGQTYYEIIRSKQSRINSVLSIFTINGQKQSSLANLNDIPDVVISSVVNNQALTYNSGSSTWVNSTIPITVFGRTGAVVAVEGDYSLNQLSDVGISSPVLGQYLGYNGSQWVNSSISTGVTSVALTVPSDLAVSGSPITTSGTLAVTRNSQAQNLVMASPNGSSGIPTYRSLTYPDLPTLPYQNVYYNIVTSGATINPAIANTHYIISLGSTITINPLNVGEHLRITAGANPITVNFTGTSFILNWSGSGGVSNPTISLTNTAIELFCTFNTGQTYYYVTSSKQSLTSIFTINTQKQSALGGINNIPDVTLSSPVVNQSLQYNGTNWVNQYPTRIYNSSGLITAPKIFIETTTTTGSGNFTISIAAAGFTTIQNAQATAILNGTTSSTAPIVSLQSVTTSTLTGIAMRSNAIVAAGPGLTGAGSGITIYITVFGV